MSIFITERDGCFLLGSQERLEELVEWSSKGKPGERWVKDFKFGLRLGFVRNKQSPKMYIHWNQHKFNSFLKTLGEHEKFSITSFGVSIDKCDSGTLVRIIGAGDTTQVLWDSEHIEFSRQQENVDVNWLVGMLCFSEDTGPVFYTQPESQQELEESTALAIIKVDRSNKEKPPALIMPHKPTVQLTNRTLHAPVRELQGLEK